LALKSSKEQLAGLQRAADHLKAEVTRQHAEIARSEAGERSLLRQVEDLEVRLGRSEEEAEAAARSQGRAGRRDLWPGSGSSAGSSRRELTCSKSREDRRGAGQRPEASDLAARQGSRSPKGRAAQKEGAAALAGRAGGAQRRLFARQSDAAQAGRGQSRQAQDRRRPDRRAGRAGSWRSTRCWASGSGRWSRRRMPRQSSRLPISSSKAKARRSWCPRMPDRLGPASVLPVPTKRPAVTASGDGSSI
jgi:hypothetical protein